MLLAVLALPLAFSACSSDSDDEPPIPDEEISEYDFVGYWKEKNSEPEPLYLILNDDGSGATVEVYRSEVDNDPFTWKFRDDNLIITFEDGEQAKREVISISKTTLVLSDKKDKITFTRVKKSDIPDVDDEPGTSKVAVVGKWRGTVYEDGESLNDWVTIELGNDMSYKDYNNSGQLIGSGSYTYSRNTITVPSGYIGDDWGNTYTVTISGNNMTWSNATMKKWNCEYRFTKQ